MYTISTIGSIALCLAPIVSSKPLQVTRTLVTRAELSAYPYGDAPMNLFKWVNWDPNSDTDKANAQKIVQSFMEWQDLVKAGAKAAADPDGATFKRWFGNENPTEIQGVFKNMLDGQTPTSIVASIICDHDDFGNKGPGNPRMASYTIPETGRFHVLPFGLQRPLLSDIDCDSLDASASKVMRCLPMTLLHEMTHYDSIGSDAVNEAIGDEKPEGAYNDFKRDSDDKIINAQNYAWLAGEQYFADECGKVFQDPAEGVAATGDDEDDEDYTGSSVTPQSTTAPTSAPITAPPPPPPPKYEPGVCAFHLIETQNCDPDDSNFFGNVSLVDNSKIIIAQTTIDPDKNPLGDSINANNPLSFLSSLPNAIVITGEHAGNYVQITYGDLSWLSSTKDGIPHCDTGDWDPKGGPICLGSQVVSNSRRQMDCVFPCASESLLAG